ncbi:hypothetical protein AB1Y20_013159 [Prymnesium parvum]|uniref:ATP-dependent DNA helicase n=1 Tax=Prymnesium parvum TaxID=97485 RepID=A0AB34IMJ3_PRYPA
MGFALLGQPLDHRRRSPPPRHAAALPTDPPPDDPPCPPPQPDPAALCTWLFPSSVDFRPYQHAIARAALLENTLVSLPTGLGKTLIASVVVHNFWRWFPRHIVVFMAPTRPLVAQQLRACCATVGLCAERDARMVSGSDPPAVRAALWRSRRLFFCTPQTLANDLQRGVLDGRRVCCLVIDEAHHAASQNYGYARVLGQLRRCNPWFRVLGLSATAGADLAAVQRVVDTLRISRIETRDEQDDELRRHIHERRLEIIDVPDPASHTAYGVMRALVLQPGRAAAARLAREGLLRHDDPTTLRAADLEAVLTSLIPLCPNAPRPCPAFVLPSDTTLPTLHTNSLLQLFICSPLTSLITTRTHFHSLALELQASARLSHAQRTSLIMGQRGMFGSSTKADLNALSRDLRPDLPPPPALPRPLEALMAMAAILDELPTAGDEGGAGADAAWAAEAWRTAPREAAPGGGGWGRAAAAASDWSDGAAEGADGRDAAVARLQAQLHAAEGAGLPAEGGAELRTLLSVSADGAAAGEWARVGQKLHPLCALLAAHFESSAHSRAIAFVGRRGTVGLLVAQLHAAPLTRGCVRAAAFVGQAARHELGAAQGAAAMGMDQAAQQQVLADFSSGACNVLVATSVAEEGLDVGECDLCICFDPVSSPIRLIQRFGRTARKREGRCVLLLTHAERRQYEATRRRADQLAAAVESGRGLELRPRAAGLLAEHVVSAMVCRFFSPSSHRQVAEGGRASLMPMGEDGRAVQKGEEHRPFKVQKAAVERPSQVQSSAQIQIGEGKTPLHMPTVRPMSSQMHFGDPQMQSWEENWPSQMDTWARNWPSQKQKSGENMSSQMQNGEENHSSQVQMGEDSRASQMLRGDGNCPSQAKMDGVCASQMQSREEAPSSQQTGEGARPCQMQRVEGQKPALVQSWEGGTGRLSHTQWAEETRPPETLRREEHWPSQMHKEVRSMQLAGRVEEEALQSKRPLPAAGVDGGRRPPVDLLKLCYTSSEEEAASDGEALATAAGR